MTSCCSVLGGHCLVLKKFQDHIMTSLSGPEISGPHNDVGEIVRSWSGPETPGATEHSSPEWYNHAGLVCRHPELTCHRVSRRVPLLEGLGCNILGGVGWKFLKEVWCNRRGRLHTNFLHRIWAQLKDTSEDRYFVVAPEHPFRVLHSTHSGCCIQIPLCR